MTTRDVGDRVNVRYTAVSADGVLTAATVALTVTSPSGVTSTPTVTTSSTGIYDASFSLTAAGSWRWTWTVTGTLEDVEIGEVLAADPAPPFYSSLSTMRQQLNMVATDTSRDVLLVEALDAASRDVETYCDGRVFWLAPTSSARVFSTNGTVCTADGYRLALFDGVVNCIGVATITVEVGDGTTFTAFTDYETWPFNALARGEAIEALVSQTDWRNNRRVRVTARWGFPTVPPQVHEATKLHANRYFKRKDSPEGVAGSSEWGLVRVPYLDPDAKRMLSRWHTDFMVA